MLINLGAALPKSAPSPLARSSELLPGRRLLEAAPSAPIDQKKIAAEMAARPNGSAPSESTVRDVSQTVDLAQGDRRVELLKNGGLALSAYKANQ